jgi:hypothetical protein
MGNSLNLCLQYALNIKLQEIKAWQKRRPEIHLGALKNFVLKGKCTISRLAKLRPLPRGGGIRPACTPGTVIAVGTPAASVKVVTAAV